MADRIMSTSERTGYWWECSNPTCDHWQNKPTIAELIRDELIPSVWDQGPLLKTCPICEQPALRMAFNLLGDGKGESHVVLLQHVVGLTWDGHPTVHMMWEWRYKNNPENPHPYYQFNYMKNRNTTGLRTPAHFTKGELERLFTLYRERADRADFL